MSNEQPAGFNLNDIATAILTAEGAKTWNATRMLLHAAVALERHCRVEIVVKDRIAAEDLRERLAQLLDHVVKSSDSPDITGLQFRWEGCSYDPHELRADVRLVDHSVEGS